MCQAKYGDEVAELAEAVAKHGDEAAELVGEAAQAVMKHADEVAEGLRYSNLDDGLNFASKALEHMEEAGRRVPIQTLQFEVLYDVITNTVYHFEYTKEAIGNLPAIK